MKYHAATTWTFVASARPLLGIGGLATSCPFIRLQDRAEEPCWAPVCSRSVWLPPWGWPWPASRTPAPPFSPRARPRLRRGSWAGSTAQRGRCLCVRVRLEPWPPLPLSGTKARCGNGWGLWSRQAGSWDWSLTEKFFTQRVGVESVFFLDFTLYKIKSLSSNDVNRIPL